MNEQMTRKFKVLDDLPMVDGVFCLDASGQPLYSSLTAPFGPQVFDDLGSATLTFFEGVAESYTPTDECILDFGPYKLYLRRGARERIIGAICNEAPNITSLRVACNLVFRSLPEEMSPINGGDEESQQSVASPAPDKASSGGGLFGVSKPRKTPDAQPPRGGSGIWG